MENMRQNTLSEDTTFQLNLLENIETRISTLCDSIMLKEDHHMSWSDLLNILSPTPEVLADKLFNHYRNLTIVQDDVYYKILNELESIGRNDENFWHSDVFWIQPLASIIYRYFKPVWWVVTGYMKSIHSDFHAFDYDYLFFEAVLTLRYKGLVDDSLFCCDADGKFRVEDLLN